MDVSSWLRDLGLEDYVQAFRANDIDAEVLPRLTAEDLIALGVTSIGHRRKLLDAIAAARAWYGAGCRRADRYDAAGRGRAAPADRAVLRPGRLDRAGRAARSRGPARGHARLSALPAPRWSSRFDGHVAKFLGDGVLAYFGWPQAHEDDAERAVRAGLAAGRGGRAARRRMPACGCRRGSGIATGLVVVGDLIGEGAAREEAVVGETPNLAARLQALAAPGSGGDRPGDAPAGRRPVRARRPRAAAAQGLRRAARGVAGRGRGPAEGRFEARQTAGLTPLVGREEEIALLLRRWRQAQGRRGPGGAALGRARDRQVAARARAARAARGRAPHPPALPVLAPSHDQPAAPGDRAAGARRRLRARRSARGQARQARGAAGARHRPARPGGAADRGAARRSRPASATRCPS